MDVFLMEKKMAIIIWYEIVKFGVLNLQMFHQLTLGEFGPHLLCVGFSAAPATSFVSRE